jgi:hypothetical protein
LVRRFYGHVKSGGLVVVFQEVVHLV